MLKNYFKIAWRNIIKSRFYSLVNILGLSVGIAFTLLIGAYVWSELQVNTNLKNARQQYIIQSKWKDPNSGYRFTSLGALAQALKQSYPDLVANYHRWDGITSNVSKGDKNFREDISICDSTLLNMYGFNLLYGNAATALHEPYTAIITKDKALKYFGKPDIVGQSITIESFSGTKHNFLITGVLDNISKNSVTNLIDNYPNNIFVSIANLDFFGRNMGWNNPHIASYVELRNGVTPQQLQKPMQHLIKLNASNDIAADFTPYLTPLKDFYFAANNGIVKKMLYALSSIAVFLLLMAIINFINMSVTKSSSRMREIGIRKVLGSMKKQLVLQFLIESVVIAAIAMLFAFIIYISTQKFFSSIVGKQIPYITDFPLYFLIFPFLFILIIGFIAGIYPSFVLASSETINSLKGKVGSVKEKVWLRKSLTAFQFAIATIAFIGAIIISKQISLFLNSNLGYNKDYILSAQLPRDWTRSGVDKMETIRDQFASVPGVTNVALSFEIPDGNNSNEVPLFKFGSDSTQSIAASILENDEKFLSLYQIPLLAGTAFEGHRLDSLKVILNEEAVHALGYRNAQQAIGQQVKIPGNADVYTIRGVTNNFHFGGMQTKVPPIIMFNLQYDFIYRYLSFKINSANIPSTINTIQKKWSSLMPGASFEYKFMDDTLANLYKSEIQLKKASYTATMLALIIVLLGVIGLVSLNIQKRTKEIGIRKVLGSSVTSIIALFMKEFLWVILIGGLAAFPLAYIIMHNWLQGYAYRINITIQPFIISIICLGFITALLICMQTIKAAITNPVKSLRTE